MSRSKKKVHIQKDSPGRDQKRLASKKFRQRERQDIHHGRDPVVHSRYVTNQYDLCDWRSFPDKDDPEYESSVRK